MKIIFSFIWKILLIIDILFYWWVYLVFLLALFIMISLRFQLILCNNLVIKFIQIILLIKMILIVFMLLDLTPFGILVSINYILLTLWKWKLVSFLVLPICCLDLSLKDLIRSFLSNIFRFRYLLLWGTIRALNTLFIYKAHFFQF